MLNSLKLRKKGDLLLPHCLGNVVEEYHHLLVFLV